MEQRSVGAVDQRRLLGEHESAQVGLTEIELDADVGGMGARLLEHRRGGVDADDGSTRCLCDRDRDPAGPDRELDDGPVGSAGEVDRERDVLGHVGGPLVVRARERFVPAHGFSPDGFSQTDTWPSLSPVKGSLFHPPERSRSRIPARAAIKSSSEGHA